MNIKHTLSDSFEYEGLWWLPENSDDQVPGKVTFSPNNGVYLELLGSFGSVETIEYKAPFQKKIILGITTDGKLCTLLDNNRVSWRDSTPGIYTQSVKSQYAFFGHHFFSEEDITFSSFGISFEHLEEWIGKSPFNVEVINDKGNLKGYKIDFVVPEPIEFPINYRNGTIRIASAFDNNQNRLKSFSVTNEAFILFRAESEQSLKWFNKLFFDIERLLMLLMGEITYPRRIQGYLKKKADDNWDNIVVIFKTPYGRTQSPSISHFEMLLPLAEISSNLQAIFEDWLINANVLRSTYDMFFAQYFKPEIYLETKFLNLMRALESFHRSTKQGKFTLRKRIGELFKGLSDGLKELVTEDEKEFTDKVVEWRNALTHYDVDSSSESIDYKAIQSANKHLKIFIVILLLKSLKIEDLVIHKRILNSLKWGRFF